MITVTFISETGRDVRIYFIEISETLGSSLIERYFIVKDIPVFGWEP